jgi:hypothetical protein
VASHGFCFATQPFFLGNLKMKMKNLIQKLSLAGLVGGVWFSQAAWAVNDLVGGICGEAIEPATSGHQDRCRASLASLVHVDHLYGHLHCGFRRDVLLYFEAPKIVGSSRCFVSRVRQG